MLSKWVTFCSIQPVHRCFSAIYGTALSNRCYCSMLLRNNWIFTINVHKPGLP